MDMSTRDAETAIDLAIPADELGLLFDDCPTSGEPAGADNGTLTIMVGDNIQKMRENSFNIKSVRRKNYYIGENGFR